jgi:hypothetical protein
LHLRLPLNELLLKLVDLGLSRSAVDGGCDLLCLAIKRLPRLLTVIGHLGDVAVVTAEDGEGAGDALRDRGHGDSLRRGQSRNHTHDCKPPNANCPPATPGEGPF